MPIEDIIVKLEEEGTDEVVASLNKVQRSIGQIQARQARLIDNLFKGTAQKLVNNATQINNLGKRFDSFGKVMQMPFELWKKFNQQGGEFNSIGARTGNRLRMATHGLRGFKMELLSVMFFGMGIQQFFTGLISSALQLTGVTDLLSVLLGVTFLEAGLKVQDLVIKLYDAFSSLPAPIQSAINDLALFGIVLGFVLSTMAATLLGVGGIILFLTDLATAFKVVMFLLTIFKGLIGALAAGFAIKFFLDSLNADSLWGSLKASLNAGIAGLIFGAIFRKALPITPLGLGVLVAGISFALGLTMQAIKEDDTIKALSKLGLASSIISVLAFLFLGISTGGAVFLGAIVFTVLASLRWIWKKDEDKIKKQIEEGTFPYMQQTYGTVMPGQPSFKPAYTAQPELPEHLKVNYISDTLAQQIPAVQANTEKINESFTIISDTASEISNQIKDIGIKYNDTTKKIKQDDTSLQTSFKVVQDGSDSFKDLNINVLDTIGSYKDISTELKASDFPATYTQQIDDFKLAIKDANDELKAIPTNWQNAVNKINSVRTKMEGATIPPVNGTYANGGYIPQTGLYKLHAGETVVPANQSFSSSPTINVYASSGMNVDELVRKVSAVIVSDLGRLSRG